MRSETLPLLLSVWEEVAEGNPTTTPATWNESFAASTYMMMLRMVVGVFARDRYVDMWRALTEEGDDARRHVVIS